MLGKQHIVFAYVASVKLRVLVKINGLEVRGVFERGQAGLYDFLSASNWLNSTASIGLT
jgi:hypothetical protein